MSKLIIEFKEPNLVEVSGNSKKSGKPYSFYKQKAYAHIPGEPYPRMVYITLPKGQADAFKPGKYDYQVKEYYVDRFDTVNAQFHLVAL